MRGQQRRSKSRASPKPQQSSFVPDEQCAIEAHSLVRSQSVHQLLRWFLLVVLPRPPTRPRQQTCSRQVSRNLETLAESQLNTDSKVARGRLPVCSPSFALRRVSDLVPPQPHPHRPDLAAAIRACLGAPGFLPRSVGGVGPEHGRAVRTVTLEEFFSWGFT